MNPTGEYPVVPAESEKPVSETTPLRLGLVVLLMGAIATTVAYAVRIEGKVEAQATAQAEARAERAAMRSDISALQRNETGVQAELRYIRESLVRIEEAVSRRAKAGQ